jgi:hypothetical protein
MATTLVGVKEWALLHDKEVISILKHIQLLTKWSYMIHGQ